MFTEEEILTQPDEFKKVLSFLNQLPSNTLPEFLFTSDIVYFVGCGSSYYLAISASKYFTRITGIETKALQSSEVLFADRFVLGSKKFKRSAVLISRSGNTTETVLAARKLSQIGLRTFAITLDQKSDLCRSCDLYLALPIDEKSVVMTKSFTCILLSLFYITDKISGNQQKYQRLAKQSEDFLTKSAELIASKSLMNANHYVFLGTGVYEGIAKESALKLEEMSLTLTEAYSTLEYRHGPKSLANQQVVIVLYASDQNTEELNLLNEMKNYGALTILREPIAKNGEDAFVQVTFAQLLGLSIAKRKGLNPDQPRNLSKVVTLSN
ncbi:MAG TPA: SIS domain-containing protein [Pseudothermotoga sp.]|nr:SIS domain-containing protein [Pseudothermotoga sp.]HOK83860.1 SIS domain-containing protein [Pseudothermotoga sp.]